MSRITRLDVRRLSARMPRPWVPASPDLHLIIVTVQDDEGNIGTGFSWTPTIGASAVTALLSDDIARFAVGREADAATLWPALWTHLHEAGGGGVTTIAMAGLDLALWDLQTRRSGLGLATALGRRHDRLPVYGSGVNLHYPLDELVAQVQRWIERGIDAVKIKVGLSDLADDVARVAAVRAVLGPDRALMIDANQRWDVPTARTALERLSEFDLAWIEEPLRSDDTAGYRALAEATSVPIALGENLHTIHRFREVLDAGFAAVVQPNVVRVGGITPFLEICSLAADRGIDVAPHLLPDLSAQLAVSLEQLCWVEDVEDAGFESLGVLAAPSPVQIRGAEATVTEAPGLGLTFVETTSDHSEESS
ncbi:MAG: mandelate racemase/muconate lactonizing enzyme family protein [Microbacterium sp.]